jgi:hypothetical protein
MPPKPNIPTEELRDFLADERRRPADLLNFILNAPARRRRTRKPRSPPHKRFGFPPSTATASLDAGVP